MTRVRYGMRLLMSRLNLLIAILAAAVLTLAAASSAHAAPAAQDVIELDPGQTIIAFRLKGDLHTTHGSFQLASGRITIDPATGAAGGEIVVDSSSSTTDNSMRDAEMHDRVLETGTYPEITFVPHSARVTRDGAGLMTGTISGDFTIHGATHPMTFNVTGTVFGNELKCESNFVIPYEAWGMRNPSWLMFRVAGKVSVDFSTVGEITWAVPPQTSGAQMKIPAQ